VTGSGGATYVQFSQIFIALLNGVICLFVAMPGLGQGHKGATWQRPACRQTGLSADRQAQRRNNESQKLCASVPLTLKLSLLGIVADFNPFFFEPCIIIKILNRIRKW